MLLLTRAGALAASFVVVIGAISLPAAAQTYTFTRIVDTANTTLDPFGFGAPAINDAGQVTFKATDANTNVQTIFRGSGGALTPVADNSGSLNFLGRLPSINNAGEVAFAATVSGGNEEILRGSGGPLVTIASTSGSPKFFAFIPSLNNVGSVAFQAELDNFDEGLFHGNGGPVTTVFTTGTSKFNDSFGSPSINDAGQIAFEAGRDAGDGGIFRFNPATNTFTTIVTNTGTFGTPDDRPSMNAAGRVAFQSLINGGTGEGIFIGDGGPVATVADSSGPFQFFQRPSLNDAGQIAFSATLDDNREGLFDGPDPVTDRILVAGQTFDGGVIEGILVDREGLNNLGQITFFVGFEGGERAAIYVATPVPEPVASGLALVGLAALTARRARR